MAPSMSSATFGVRSSDTGVASALVNTAQQIGGSIGTRAAEHDLGHRGDHARHRARPESDRCCSLPSWVGFIGFFLVGYGSISGPRRRQPSGPSTTNRSRSGRGLRAGSPSLARSATPTSTETPRSVPVADSSFAEDPQTSNGARRPMAHEPEASSKNPIGRAIPQPAARPHRTGPLRPRPCNRPVRGAP